MYFQGNDVNALMSERVAMLMRGAEVRNTWVRNGFIVFKRLDRCRQAAVLVPAEEYDK